MGIDEIEIIRTFQNRINSSSFQKGIKGNYILCSVFFGILHFSFLASLVRIDLFVNENIVQQNITIIQNYINDIPQGFINFFIIWIMATLIFSIKSISKKEDEENEKSLDRIKGVKDPKCNFCSSKMDIDLNCTNPKCKAHSHKPAS